LLQTALLWWIWLGGVVFVLGCLARAARYMRAPAHLRWDLYPVAHEPRRDHGGSYLEEREWWTRPRKKSQLGAAVVMAEEILLLHGVFKNNRSVWWGSMPFHWGLYLLIVTSFGLLLAALGLSAELWLTLLQVGGVLGGLLLALGSLYLLLLRLRDPRLRPYTAPVDLMNLGLLGVFGALSTAVALLGMAPVVEAVSSLTRLTAPEATPLLAAQMATGALFLLYFPATRMVHMFAKYFTYHDVRWDDRPRTRGSALDRSLSAALEFGVSWSAPHVGAGRTWAEVATKPPEPKGE
jgi:nitrate reductase gamma subunit